MSWASDLPQELLWRPMGLVALTGLDTTYNAVHKAIWDSFCNNRRPDRVPLHFKVFSTDYEYHKCKPKKNSYEYYIPKGILKSYWMKKQLEEIPSVVVVFFDLDWDNTIWKEREMECSTKVEIVRNSLQGRATRVCMVLIQKNAPLPPGEDMIAAERAASLCSACELSAKSLFVLPLTDHILGYTIRLENAFYELSQSYYHTEARKVKSHKEFLNKTTHQLLYVRHQFKIAFLSELKQDLHMALKHYKQAYSNIMETRMHDTNILEVKTTAGFINYKICRLSFQNNAPLDAIAQFRKHLDFFKNRVGASDLAFEHSAWLSKQFQVFGDLFDEAIKLGLTAIQTQHPGFYYQQAAHHAIARKQLCVGLCHPPASTTEATSSLPPLDYFGQRWWRQGHQSIEPPDSTKEKEGIQMLQGIELQVDHSKLTIPLLSSAVSQFKKYKSPRMKRYLMVQMGEEYYHAKDYTKALTLLSRVTWDYRQERWWPLLTSILHTALRCAYLVADVQEYVNFALELIGQYTQSSPNEKARVQLNLNHVVKGNAPEPEPGCNSECVDNAKSLWAKNNRPTNNYTIQMQNVVPFVECKCCFTKDNVSADVPVVIKVFIRIACPLPMKFTRLSLLLSNQAYNSHCVIVGEDSLTLKSDVTMVKTFTFLPQAEDVGKIIEITGVTLELQNAKLHWSGGGGDSLPPSVNQTKQLRTKKRQEVSDTTPWETVDAWPITRVKPRESLLSVEINHSPPCLVNEFYHLQLKLTNQEESKISNLRLDVGLKEAQGIELAQSTHVSVDMPVYKEGSDRVPTLKDVGLEDLEAGQTLERDVYLRAWRNGDRKVMAKVCYDVEVTRDNQTLRCQCIKEVTLMLPTVKPFDVVVKLASLQFKVVESIHCEEPFLLLCDTKCVSPWILDIQTSDLKLSGFVKSVDDSVTSQLDTVTLNPDDHATECQCLVAPPSIQSTIPLGQYSISWRRKSDNPQIPYVSTLTPLPAVSVEMLPLFVDLDMPSYGNVRSSLPVTYTIYNRTPYSQEIEVTMDPSESFMFSGQKSFHMRILPNNKHQLQYTFVPLLPGNAPLPKLHVNMLRFPGQMDDLVQAMLPSHVFIMPRGKQVSDITEVKDTGNNEM